MARRRRAKMPREVKFMSALLDTYRIVEAPYYHEVDQEVALFKAAVSLD